MRCFPARTSLRPAAWLVLVLVLLPLAEGTAAQTLPPHFRPVNLTTDKDRYGGKGSGLAPSTKAHSMGYEQPTHYHVTDLGATLSGSSRAYSVSDGGDVVGILNRVRMDPLVGVLTPLPNDHNQVVVWRRGRPRVLAPPFGYDSSFVVGASRLLVAGTACTVITEPTIRSDQRAFLWHADSGFTDLGTLPGFPDSAATALDAAGEVVGTLTFTSDVPDFDAPSSQVPHAFFWHNGRMTDLGVGQATSVSHGVVAGFTAWDEENGLPQGVVARGRVTFRAWRWASGHWVNLGAGRVFDVNGRGQAVGDSGSNLMGYDLERTEGGEATLWSGGRTRLLGTFGGNSAALSINDRGEVVGDVVVSRSRDIDRRCHAFVWQNGQMHDLNGLISPKLGWVLEVARGVNNRGEIVGWGLHHGQARAFLLTPLRKT